MATPNYGYEKRQRELAKKKKKEEKLRAKTADRRPDQDGYAPQADHQGQQQGQQQAGNDNGAGADPAPAASPSGPQGQAGQ